MLSSVPTDQLENSDSYPTMPIDQSYEPLQSADGGTTDGLMLTTATHEQDQDLLPMIGAGQDTVTETDFMNL